MAALVTALVLVAFLLGFRFYARFIGRRIYEDEEEITTPAHAQADGRDFVAAPRHVLFGHHFTSIAGAAPIIGPCIAVYWGWLPALFWVVFGTLFMGAVHDFGALVASVRERGRSIADIAGNVITPRVRVMFLCFVLVLTWLVLAVFAIAIARQFHTVPTSVVPINVEIVLALAMGHLLYKKGTKTLGPSLVALALLYLFVWVGTHVPVDFVELGLAADAEGAERLWCLILFGYSAVASLLPVWLLLQPRDYINSHQLFVGLGLVFLGIFVFLPPLDAPAIHTGGGDSPSLFPLLFVTIACGAISGFHGLVSSGTTSKQLDRLRDARVIGYGGMLGEGSLALASVMAAAAGIALVGACELPSHPGGVADLSWNVYYRDWGAAQANGPHAFVLGGGALLEQLGLPASLARTLMAVLVISFAATTLDTATRIERFIVTEVGRATGLRPLKNPYVATVVALLPAAFLVFWSIPDPASGQVKQAAMVLWPIFGSSNQMLAALTLMVLALYFWRRRRPILPLVLPMVFVTVVAFGALVVETGRFIQQQNWPLVALDALLLALITWMIVESLAVVARARRERAGG